MKFSLTRRALLMAQLAVGLGALAFPVHADARKDMLVVVGEQGPNSLDTLTPTANDYTRFVAWHAYDRLVSFGTKVNDAGVTTYDKDTITGELAESWEVIDGGKAYIFHLRKDATFHDGSPVEAKDVKWSFDRALAAGGFPKIQMGAGSLNSPDQFEVIDTHTFKVSVPDGNKLALPDLGVPIPIVINSDLALSHATADDPWANAWLANNTAGGGAYKVIRFTPGNELIFERFDDWKNGPVPAIKRVVYRQISSAGTRRALLEKGDADVSLGLPPKDFAEIAQDDRFKVIGVPKQSSLVGLELNLKDEHFSNPKVREAVAYAIPYQEIIDKAWHGRAEGMFGADPAAGYEASWPVKSPYYTDLDKAKALLAEAGYPEGFKTNLFFDLSNSTIYEPAVLLIQENLAKIGITSEVEKVPGANWIARLLEKSMPGVFTGFFAWLDYADYHFYWTYHGGNNSVFNTSGYQSAEFDALIDKARFETDTAAYEAQLKEAVALAMKDLPKIPIAQDFHDVAFQKNIDGYEYWFNSHLNLRTLVKN